MRTIDWARNLRRKPEPQAIRYSLPEGEELHVQWKVDTDHFRGDAERSAYIRERGKHEALRELGARLTRYAKVQRLDNYGPLIDGAETWRASIVVGGWLTRTVMPMRPEPWGWLAWAIEDIRDWLFARTAL